MSEKMDLPKLYKKQISFTEWFKDVKHEQTITIREEDNNKRERLSDLNKIILIPYDAPVEFKAVDLTEMKDNVKEYISQHKSELCALRLIPINPEFPKLRMRGHTVSEVMNWYNEQSINPKEYRAQFVPHANNYLWSTIFIVNKMGIFGEIIKGIPDQLSQGFYDGGKPITFYYNFKEWELSENNSEALKHLKSIIKHLFVSDELLKEKIIEKFKSDFSQNYLNGYFETTFSIEYGLWFIDWNRIVGKLYDNYIPKIVLNTDDYVFGQIGCRGKSRGVARIVSVEQLESNDYIFNENDILICQMTSPDYVPLMKKAKGIITDEGGILSHAAIVSRELKIPCIVGTGNATIKIKDGQLIEIDAENGVVKYKF